MIEKNSLDILWLLLCAGMVFMMQAGFLCLEAGLTRAKNSINVAIKNLTDFSIAVILYWAFGFALMFGTSNGGFIGTNHFFVGYKGDISSWSAAFFLFQLMFCGTAVTIISGAVAERTKFGAYLIVALIVAAFIYPVFGHWAWGGAYDGGLDGWLARQGFIDFAGSTVVHSVGGWVALAILLVVGPRKGRFPENQAPQRIAGNNLPLSMLGILFLWFGWIGFNGGSTFAMNDNVPMIITNTMLAGGAGAVIGLLMGRLLYEYYVVELVMNGALAGLVAITAASHAVNGLSAVVIGAIGAIVMSIAQRLMERLRIDDAVGAVPVHAVAGVWGTLAVALFANPGTLTPGFSRWEQFQVQLLGVAVCFLFAFGVTYLFLSLINRIFPLRVSPEAEDIGLNIAEHRIGTEIKQ